MALSLKLCMREAVRKLGLDRFRHLWDYPESTGFSTSMAIVYSREKSTSGPLQLNKSNP